MPTATATYAVSDNDQVVVDVLVGDAQPGGSTVFLGTVQLITGGVTLTNVPIGKGSDIRGKKLVVATEVTDKSPDTDRTSTQITVKGGAAPKTIGQAQVAAKKGEIVSYVTVISFS